MAFNSNVSIQLVVSVLRRCYEMNQISGFVKHLATVSGLQSNANYVYYVPVRQFFKTVHGTGVMVPYFVSAFYGARIYLHIIYTRFIAFNATQHTFIRTKTNPLYYYVL